MKINALLDVNVVAHEAEDEVAVLLELEAPAAVPDAARPQASLQVVLDRSGSMDGAPLEGAKRALVALVRRLDPTDNFGLVTFDDTAQVVVPAGPLTDKDAVIDQIQSVRSGGTTDLSAGYLRGLREIRRVMTGGHRMGGTVLVILTATSTPASATPTSWRPSRPRPTRTAWSRPPWATAAGTTRRCSARSRARARATTSSPTTPTRPAPPSRARSTASSTRSCRRCRSRWPSSRRWSSSGSTTICPPSRSATDRSWSSLVTSSARRPARFCSSSRCPPSARWGSPVSRRSSCRTSSCRGWSSTSSLSRSRSTSSQATRRPDGWRTPACGQRCSSRRHRTSSARPRRPSSAASSSRVSA